VQLTADDVMLMCQSNGRLSTRVLYQMRQQDSESCDCFIQRRRNYSVFPVTLQDVLNSRSTCKFSSH